MKQKIFWGTRDEVTGDWRRLHYEELYDILFARYSGDIFQKNEMGKACGMFRRQKRFIQCFRGEI